MVKKKKCIICGAEHISVSACCSSECELKNKERIQKAKSEFSTVCKVCGERTYKKDFCSEKCAEKWEKKKKICAICGKEFYAPNGQACCGDICRRKHLAKKNKKSQEKKTKSCPICGNDFTPKYYTQVYCGDDCKKEGMRKSIRKYKKSVRERRVYFEKACEICGTPFKTRNPRQRRCDDCTKNKKRLEEYRIVKSFAIEDPWASGRLSEEITSNQFTGWMI